MDTVGQNQKQELLKLYFEDCLDSLAEWERVCLRLQPGDPVQNLEPVFRCAHNMKGGAGLVGLQNLYEQLHQFEDALVIWREQSRVLSTSMINALLNLENLLKSWLRMLREDPQANFDTSAMHAELNQVNAQPVAKVERTFAATPATKTARGAERIEETLRVGTGKLDHLIQLVGELSLHQAILERAGAEGTLDSASVRGVIDVKTKLTQDLQDAALSLRMIPVEGLFQRVERVVRETASHLHKLVTIQRRGDDVTLDKLVIERILDPLIHVARNALDHGIETPAERKLAGKPERGTVTLTAAFDVGGVSLIFQDDGRGIDGERVFQKALEKGLISKGTELDLAGKQNLIFMAGLSTADRVSEISGRGVGMDVVADAVAKMAGRVELHSVLGQGTRFTITLPTNLSILDALIVEVRSCQYAIPNQEVIEVINLRDHAVSNVSAGRGRVFTLRGRLIPVLAMGAFLEHHQGHSSDVRDQRAPEPALLVQHRDWMLALEIDRVVGQQKIFVRPVIDSLVSVGVFGGSTILSDGEPSLILKLGEMARIYFDSLNPAEATP